MPIYMLYHIVISTTSSSSNPFLTLLIQPPFLSPASKPRLLGISTPSSSSLSPSYIFSQWIRRRPPPLLLINVSQSSHLHLHIYSHHYNHHPAPPYESLLTPPYLPHLHLLSSLPPPSPLSYPSPPSLPPARLPHLNHPPTSTPKRHG